jgi:L-amino acid N-acyltransferase YncA
MSIVAIRPATLTDADAIMGIYNYYVKNTVITFEEEPVSSEEMARRMSDVWAAKLPWLVAEDQDGHIVGYAYAHTMESAHRISVFC